MSKIILFEYAKPIDLTRLLNYEAFIWQFTISPGVVTVTDDNGNTGYYDWQNDTIYNVISLKAAGIDYAQVNSLADLRLTDQAFYYDPATTILYIKFTDSEPQLDKQVTLGAAVGYSLNNYSDCYFNDLYYEPRIRKIFAIKKSIDPLFYGLLKYQSGKITFENSDGFFDTWRSLNLFAQKARVLIGDEGDNYAKFKVIYEGYIEDDSRDFESFELTIQDQRKGLTQPIATNLLTKTDYPYISDSNANKPKPVAYGKIFDANCICLNESESASNYTFLICDTSLQTISTLDAVYIAGASVTPSSTNLSAGTFVLTSGQVGSNKSKVTADFTMSISNGIDIIKDLLYVYDGKTYLSDFWDTTEVDAAELSARDTSLYIDSSSKKLSECIQSVCNDIDARFFVKDNGKYTIRLYDSNRETSDIIYNDEWLNDPSIENNGSEYLTSAVVKYWHKQDADSFRQYENKDYQETAFNTYKKLKADTFETNLTNETDAIAKSETIMSISSNVQDLITRDIPLSDHINIEITDFVVASPYSRVGAVEDFGVYEVMEVIKNIETDTLTITLRYVKDYTPVEYNYFELQDENGNTITDSEENSIIGLEIA